MCSTKPTRFEVYKGKNGDWYWRAYRGTRVVADSAEGYRRKKACADMLLDIIDSIRNGPPILSGDLKVKRAADKP